MAFPFLRRALGDIAAVALTAGLFLLAAETALRSTSYKRYIITTSVSVKGLFETDPVAGYDMKPNLPPTTLETTDVTYDVWSNELGCYDRPYDGKGDYILLIGDSQSQWYTPLADKWPSIVEEILGVRVLKCAMDGYGLKGELRKARKVLSALPKDPKMILLGYTVNEVRDDHVFPMMTVMDGYRVLIREITDEVTGDVSVRTDYAKMREEVENYEKLCSQEAASSAMDYAARRAGCWLSRNSILFNMAKEPAGRITARVMGALEARGLISKREETGPARPKKEIRTLGCNIWYTPPEKYPWIQKAWETQQELFVELKELARSRGAEPFVVMIVENEQVYSFFPRGDGCDVEIPNRMCQKFSETAGIPYIGLLEDFRRYADQTPRPHLDPEKDFYWRYDGHWNVKGNHLAGLLVARRLLESGLLDIADREKKMETIDRRLKAFEAGLN